MITLTTPIAVRNLTRLKVQAVQYEQNEEKGKVWVDVYCEYGFMDNGNFISYPVPGKGTSVLHFRFENGCHPASPGTMLGRCNTCNLWQAKVSGPCNDVNCKGAVSPFPSYNRFRNKIDASTERDIFKATEAFLINTDGAGIDFPALDDIGKDAKEKPLVEGA
jgi:hypothetical protein